MSTNFFCGLTGRIVVPNSPFYEEARQDWNRAIQQYPFIIVYCADKSDVSNAVIWSRRHCIPLRIRNGGHNYEGYSNGDCTLIIDVSEMNSLEIDECENLLHVQGGVTNKDVYEFVSSRGYPFPGGTCPTVGLSGYALGGGWGLSCRYLGLGCDSLVEIEIINYEGDIIKANRTFHPDLFWACRGAGGGNFGVIVSMTFRLPPQVENVTLIEIDYQHISSAEQVSFLLAWQDWLKTADNRMTLISRIYNSEADGLAMLVRGIFYGQPNEAVKMLKPFLKLDGAEYSFEYLSFLEAVQIIGSTYPTSETFQSGSRFVLKEFSIKDCVGLVEMIQDRPIGSVYMALSMYALGGRVAETPVGDTAFFYRNAKYIIWLETIWEERRYAEPNTEWIETRFPYLESITTGSYVNFPYGELDDYLEQYYGWHAGRLRAIKRKYDPLNIFTFPQGIQRSGYSYPQATDMSALIDDNKERTAKVSTNKLIGTNHRGFRYVKR